MYVCYNNVISIDVDEVQSSVSRFYCNDNSSVETRKEKGRRRRNICVQRKYLARISMSSAKQADWNEVTDNDELCFHSIDCCSSLKRKKNDFVLLPSRSRSLWFSSAHPIILQSIVCLRMHGRALTDRRAEDDDDDEEEKRQICVQYRLFFRFLCLSE